MKNTTFISAGAGSGKTYTLMDEISQLIGSGEYRADEIILTTYTENAAKELREKVRKTLYAKGLYDAAREIDNAAIGTIHSIALKFVSRYWYLLGLSPSVSILDDQAKEFCINQSLASLPSEANIEHFSWMLEAFNITHKESGFISVKHPDFWKDELRNLIDRTNELCLTTDDIREAKEESKRLVADAFKLTQYNIDGKDLSRLIDIAKQLLNEKLAEEVSKSINKHLPFCADCKEGLPIPLYHFGELAKTIAGIKTVKVKKEYPSELRFADDLYQKIPYSQQVLNLMELHIDIIFDLAIKWKHEYEAFKRKRCLLDYNDLLEKFDQLLGMEEQIADIKRYKVALVDEFQDCSPLQVRSFTRLSHLMEKSFWVGDIKQAIYGFRGTNTKLISSLIQRIEQSSKDGGDNNKLRVLDKCWRSSETIVDFVNYLFCEKVFKQHIARGEMKKEHICLSPVHKKNNDKNLTHWHLTNAASLAEKVKKLIDTNTYKPHEIAILYRSAPEIRGCIEALRKLNIPYQVKLEKSSSQKKTDNEIDPIASFLGAVVSFAANENNELAKAIIVNRIEQGYTASKILSDRLRYLDAREGQWLNGLPIIDRFEQLRKRIGSQSVSAAVESIVVELDLADLIRRIDCNAPTYNYCEALIAAAKGYEAMCKNLGLSISLMGFAAHLKESPIEYPGDDAGVDVMTYHKSKGLERPCVILCSLDSTPIKFDRDSYDVLTLYTEQRSEVRLIPVALKLFTKLYEEHLVENDFFKSLYQSKIDEERRLMYVGMTRPKSQLILATKGDKECDKWLVTIGCDPMHVDSPASVIQWADREWDHPDSTGQELADEQRTKEKEVGFKSLKLPTELPAYEAKYVVPSNTKAEQSLYQVELCGSYGGRLKFEAVGPNDFADQNEFDATVGDFIHHTMCLWNGEKGLIESLAGEYRIKVDAESVAATIEGFWQWMEQRYGKAVSVERELPFCYTNAKGQVITGIIDLLYRTADGDVLVDYKSYRGNVDDLTQVGGAFNAERKYGGPISLYEEALTQSGYQLSDRLICYLSLGVAIRFTPKP